MLFMGFGDWVRLMGGVVFLGSLNGWVDGLGSEIDSCGFFVTCFLLNRVMVVRKSDPIVTDQLECSYTSCLLRMCPPRWVCPLQLWA